MSNIEKLYIFDGLSKEEITYFLLMSQVQYHEPNEVIMRQDDPSNGCAYYINSGSVRLIRNGKEIKTLKEGAFFGEMALITDEPRSATIETSENTELQVFLKDDFFELMKKSPYSEDIKAEIRKRIAENNNK